MNGGEANIENDILGQMRIINPSVDPTVAASLILSAEEQRVEDEEAAKLFDQLNPKQREQLLNTQFFSNLIHQRHYYADKLAPIARHNYQATGIETTFQFVPEELLGHLPSGSLHGSLSLGFDTGPDKSFALTNFAIELEDGPQIEVTTDWLSTSLLVNGEAVAMYMDSNLTENMLRCLLPPGAPDIGPAALAYALYTLGSYRSHAMKAGTEDAQFAFISEETTEDSQHLLEITASLPEHSSGKTIVLKASIIEGLLQATHNLSSQGALDLSAVPGEAEGDTQLYVDQIIGHKSVRVERLTEVHREIISTALQEFVQMADARQQQSKPKN